MSGIYKGIYRREADVYYMNEQKLYHYTFGGRKDHTWSNWAGYIFAADKDRASALLVQKFVHEEEVRSMLLTFER